MTLLLSLLRSSIFDPEASLIGLVRETRALTLSSYSLKVRVNACRVHWPRDSFSFSFSLSKSRTIGTSIVCPVPSALFDRSSSCSCHEMCFVFVRLSLSYRLLPSTFGGEEKNKCRQNGQKTNCPTGPGLVKIIHCSSSCPLPSLSH